MNNGAEIFGIGITFSLFAVFASIRWGGLSAKVAGIIMTVAPILLLVIIYIAQGGDILQVICSPLLSLAFGPTTYAMGRIIEQKAKGDQDIFHK
mgnify:CR=1 FL=1